MTDFNAGVLTGVLVAYLWPVAVALIVVGVWYVRRGITRLRFQRACLEAVKQRNAGSGMGPRTSGAVQSSEKVEPSAGGIRPGSTSALHARYLYIEPFRHTGRHSPTSLQPHNNDHENDGA